MDTFTSDELFPVAVGADLGGFRVTAAPQRDGDPFDAVDPDGKRVTVTLVEREAAEAPGFARRFRRLVRARTELDHPSLLPVRGWGKSAQALYLVMERSEAPTLAERLRAGPLDSATSMRLLAQVADALEAAHAVGLVARAFTPEDIRVDAGRALLGDLGIGRSEHPGLSLMVSDSVYYASPEELRDEPLLPQSNVYSLACILTECLTGAPPYPNEQRVAVSYAHLTEAPPALTERRPELPAEIDEVIGRAMAAEADDRYPSPAALMQAAGSALGTTASPPATSRPATAGPRPVTRRLCPSSRAALALAAAVGVLVAGVAGYAAGTREEPAARQVSRPPAIGADVQRLKASRLDERTRLSKAKRPGTQAAIARELAASYGASRAAISRRGAPPVLLRAMTRSQSAYMEFSAAARRRKRGAYRSATRSVRAAERELDAALRGRAPG